MFDWIINSIGTISVAAVVAAIVAVVVIKMVKNRRKGNSSCGCGCSGCPMSQSCRKH